MLARLYAVAKWLGFFSLEMAACRLAITEGGAGDGTCDFEGPCHATFLAPTITR